MIIIILYFVFTYPSEKGLFHKDNPPIYKTKLTLM